MQPIRHSAKPPNVTTEHSPGHWFEKGFPRAFAWLATTVYRLTGDWQGWLPLFARTSAHLAVIAVAIMTIGLSSIEWPAQAASDSLLTALSVSSGPPSPAKIALSGNDDTQRAAEDTLVSLTSLNGQNSRISTGDSIRAIARLAQPHTIIPERPRLGVITYTVQAGDTVQSIAASFGLQPTTISWSNPAIEDAPDLLRIGQQVTILPINGAYHEVTEGDTLESIAEEYKAEATAIVNCEYNPLEAPNYPIVAGMWLIIPGGEKPYVPKVVTTYTGSVPEGAEGTGQFQWPVLGRITQGYWYGHRAIDIGAPTGSAVVAADGGFISFAGWTDVGYGYLVVVDHANSFTTYYAHLSNIYVFEGQAIERGQVMGAVGSTGWSTGPHLHFEVRYGNVQQNPRAYLP